MKRIVFFILIVFLLVSCREYNTSTASYDSVVFIGIDSAGSFLGDDAITGFKEVFKTNSSVNYHCRCEEPSISAHNWASFLHGVSPETHKCVNGSIACERFPYLKYPSIFKILRKVYPSSRLASFSEWNPINFGLIESSANVEKSSDVRFCSSVHNTDEIMQMTLEYLQKNNTPKLLFVHLDNVDSAGHSSDYKSENYYKALQKDVDFVAQVNELIDGNTLLIVATDHGGVNFDHGGTTDAEMDITIAIKGKTVSQSELSVCTPKDVSVIILKALGIDKPSFMEGNVPEGLTL